MSVILAGAAAGLYAATVIGIHRYAVGRRRRRAGGFAALARLDWDSLFKPLQAAPTEAAEVRDALLRELAAGSPPADLERRAADAGFAGGELGYLATLALAAASAGEALERLERTQPTTAPELYLREHLRLILRTNALNLEWTVFGAKRRLGFALARFGDEPCLYYARAYASARVGMNRAAIDDLARAVYFSHQAPFYLRAVLDTPYIEEVRPVLAYQCRRALSERTERRIAG